MLQLLLDWAASLGERVQYVSGFTSKIFFLSQKLISISLSLSHILSPSFCMDISLEFSQSHGTHSVTL